IDQGVGSTSGIRALTPTEVTPTEVIQDQGSSEKGNSEVSTAGATKGTASEVPMISIVEENINTAEENISTLEELLLTEEGVKRKGQEKTREKQ
ncbi:hypothetical protein Tco_0055856, partial [Tanacetum coccineum]